MGPEIGGQVLETVGQPRQPGIPFLLPSLDPILQATDEAVNVVVLGDYVVRSGGHGGLNTTTREDDLVQRTEISRLAGKFALFLIGPTINPPSK